MTSSQTAKTKTNSGAKISIDSPQAFLNREISWLAFARRVLALAEDPQLPLFERLKFAGIVGMLHDEFFMKRMSGLKRQVERGIKKPSVDGASPLEQYKACQKEIKRQTRALCKVVSKDIRAQLKEAQLPILDYGDLKKTQLKYLKEYFLTDVRPVLTPLAVDAEHPFPFISNLSLNLAIRLPLIDGKGMRFVRIKVPDNLPRFVALPKSRGFVPLEQIIAANLHKLFPGQKNKIESYFFRVIRGAEGETEENLAYYYDDSHGFVNPGAIIRQVSEELKARRFAEVVCMQLEKSAPRELKKWLSRQLKIEATEVYETDTLLGLSDLTDFAPDGCEKYQYAHHEPVTHPFLRDLSPNDSPEALFRKICERDILLHHPYHCFDTSVLQFIRSAANDPEVLAIKLTIYRTSDDSPIIQALVDAARQGKQVAVLIEVTARFDEAPNISWGELLENEGVHVAYGVERLKTHVKLALVTRREDEEIRQYLHVGTGNYHTGTARIYEDLGLLTCDPDLCHEAADLFNELTGAIPIQEYRTMLIAPHNMRTRFTQMIRRETRHAKVGKPCGIRAKMNQLQDAEIIRELYRASRAGVPITLIVRGLCCLRPGVPALSDNIRVYSVVGRFLEHSRIYGFVNGGEPEYYIGSADWMTRNLDQRVESVAPLKDPEVKQVVEKMLDIYDEDNASAWDCDSEGKYRRRRPGSDSDRKAVQERLSIRAHRNNAVNESSS